MSVGSSQSFDHRRGNFSLQVVKVPSSGQVTNGPVVIVARYPVVPSSLKIQSRKIKTREWCVLVLKQVVRHFVGQELVKSFHGGGGHSANQVVQHAGLVQLVWIEEHD